MTLDAVYVVMGSTGEYSDRVEWAVAGYFDEARANARADAATVEAKRIEQELKAKAGGPRTAWWVCREAKEARSGQDPDFSINYTGTDYYVMKVPLAEAPHE